MLQDRERGNAAAGLRHKGAHEKLRSWRVTSPGEEWSTRKRICARFEDAVGELEFPDIADELFNLLICYAGDGRHIPEPPVVLGHAIADSIANAEVGVVARFVNPVNEGRAGG